MSAKSHNLSFVYIDKKGTYAAVFLLVQSLVAFLFSFALSFLVPKNANFKFTT